MNDEGLQLDNLSALYENYSGSGIGNGSDPQIPFIPHFPCRAQPISKDSLSPIVWGSLPQVSEARWFVVTIESIFLVVGLAWNLFIISCFIRNRKLLKQPGNIYLLNLAITDILISLFVTFTTLTAEAAGDFVFGFSDFSRCITCKVFGVAMHILVAVSLHTLAAMSVDRCVFLTQPMHYGNMFTWKMAVFILFVIWTLSIAVAVPPLFQFGDYEYNLVFSFCNARWSGKSGDLPNIYYILFYALEALIPIFILTFTNIWIVKIAKKALKQRITRQRSYRGNNSDGRGEEKKYKRQQKQLIRVFGALFIAHIVCWVPVISVMFVALGLGAENIPPETFIAGWLAFLTNPVIHPILETFFVQELRYKVNKTKKSMRQSVKKASSSLYSQVSTTSLLKSISRPSRTSLDPPIPATSSFVGLSTRPSRSSLDPSPPCTSSSTSLNGSQKEHVNFQCALDSQYMQDKAFGHKMPQKGKSRIEKRKSTVSFKLDSLTDKCSFEPDTPDNVFNSEDGNVPSAVLEQSSPTSDIPKDDNIEAGRTEE